MALTRAEILARKPRLITVTLADGAEVLVRGLLKAEFDRIRSLDPKDENLALQVAMVLCDNEGNLVYDHSNPDDLKALNESFEFVDMQLMIHAVFNVIKTAKADAAKKSEASTKSDSVSS